MDGWSVADAKAMSAKSWTAPDRTVMVIPSEEWERRTKRDGSLADFFARSPLRGAKLKIEPIKGGVRSLDL